MPTVSRAHVPPPPDRTVPPSLHRGDPPALARVAFVLVGTSHPGNVGAAARAMKTMGLADLRLVAPRFADGTAILVAHPITMAPSARTSMMLSAPCREIGVFFRENRLLLDHLFIFSDFYNIFNRFF